jgi:thiamine biosynthesis lipoprotein
LLDLGGIAKGWTADAMRDIARDAGAQGALVSLGSSSVACHGARPDSRPWQVAIQDPEGADGLALGTLPLGSGQSLSTSGTYRTHPIIDPRTARPADSGLTSVTIIAPDGPTAEALSTAILVSGHGLAARLQAQCLAFDATLITPQAVMSTPGARFTATLATEPVAVLDE